MTQVINTHGLVTRSAIEWTIGDYPDSDREIFVSANRTYGSLASDDEFISGYLSVDEARALAHALLTATGEEVTPVVEPTLSRGDVRAIAAEVIDEKLRAAIGG